MTQNLETRLLIVGGGPGGYVAAIRAAQLGIQTVLVEAETLGGTCLNVGCIPSKALIHVADEYEKAVRYAGKGEMGIRVQAPTLDIGQAVKWKNGIVGKLTKGVAALLKKHDVQVIHGWARLVDGKTAEVVQHLDGQQSTLRIRCEHLLLATGSQSVELPFMPFGGKVISATQALSPTTLPERLVVVGGGYIGLELGIAYRKLGVAVTVVEAQERILPGYDSELTAPLLGNLKRLGINLHLGHKVLGLNSEGTAVRVSNTAEQISEIPADQVLVAVGRKPRTEGFGLETLLLDYNGSALKVDDQCRTSMRNVWAIGDLTGDAMLAHRAMAQGEMVADIIAGKHRHFLPAAIPAICFTDPEVVVVGLTPEQAQQQGIEHKTAMFPFAANGRSMTLGSTEGFVRVVARADNHRILGWQATGRGVSELSIAFVQSLEMGAQLEDIAATVHPHPTLGEAVQEAAMRALGHALHI